MNRLLSFSAVLVSMLVLCAGAAMAQGDWGPWAMHGDMAYGCGMMGGGMMGGGMMGGMLCGMADGYDWEAVAETLDLTEEQKNQIMMHNRDTVRGMMESRNALSMKMFDLNTELKQTEPDRARIGSLIDEIAQMQKQMLENRVKAIQQMRKVLSPDQWERFKHMPMMMGEKDMPMMRSRRGMHMMR
jgi:Spy/CpxP family protein refolding chaperone